MQAELRCSTADDDLRLLDAGLPVIERLQADLAGTDVVAALEHQGSTEPRASSAPIVDPGTGECVGAVTLSGPAAPPNRLLVVVARSVAREIAGRLCDRRPRPDRTLEEQFLRVRRRCRAPIAVVGEQTLLSNAAAARILRDVDHSTLWADVQHAVATGASRIRVRADTEARVEAVHDGKRFAGAVVHVHAIGASDCRAGRPTLGLNALTDSEREVADLVADGLTNKRAAARLFISHHTVDTHLRSIYRKLDINSRVDLARVLAHERALDPSRTGVRAPVDVQW